jgi:transcriptional regulator with XRE-family HTH domain
MPRIAEFLGYVVYDPTEPLPKRLRVCRTALGLSQREIARLLAVDPKAIWEWETGVREPGRKSQRRISQFLKLP